MDKPEKLPGEPQRSHGDTQRKNKENSVRLLFFSALFWKRQSPRNKFSCLLCKFFTPKILIIFGQQDANVPVSDGHLAAQHIPDSRLVLIDRCGHFPMYEQTEYYLEALRDFL